MKEDLDQRKSLKEIYTKFIIIFSLFLTIPSLGLYFFVFKPLIKQASEITEKNIEKLSNYLEKNNVNLIESNECQEGRLGYFHYKNFKNPEVVICTNNFNSEDRAKYWSILVHESVHVAQQCNGGILSDEERFKYMTGQLTAFSMNDYMTIHNAYSSNSYEKEVEAFFYENRYHQEIFKVYEDYCLKKSVNLVQKGKENFEEYKSYLQKHLYPNQKLSSSYVDYLISADEELVKKQDLLNRDLEPAVTWEFDREKEMLLFYDENNNLLKKFEIIVLGSYSNKFNTWKWAWDNSYFPQNIVSSSKITKEIVNKTKSDIFLEKGAFPLKSDLIWILNAAAVKHFNGRGFYVYEYSEPDFKEPDIYFLIKGEYK